MREPKILRPAPWYVKMGAWLMVRIVGLLCATTRLHIDGEAEANRFLADCDGAMQLTWHGRVLYPMNRWRGRGYHLIVSLSNDGDLVSEYIEASGLKVVRGSSSRRAAGMTLEALKILKRGEILALTPDGPRGPAQVVQEGAIYLARKSGKPIVYGGISVWPRWEVRSWDNFIIPKPFARVRWIYGEPMHVGPNDNLEEARLKLETALNTLQEQAERDVRGSVKAKQASA